MRRIDELLEEARTFEGMSREQLELIAGCAVNEVFAPGSYLMREGDRADRFYVIRRGHVSLEIFVPQRGGLTLETLGPAQLLGWSWLIPPYRVDFDARAQEETHAIAFDATCLRGKFDEDAALGYELMRRFIPVIVERLQATRMRLLDVYGHVAS